MSMNSPFAIRKRLFIASSAKTLFENSPVVATILMLLWVDDFLVPRRNLVPGLFCDREFVCLPGMESAVHFHDRITLSREFDARRGAQVADMRVTVNYVELILPQAGRACPLLAGQTQGATNVSLVEVFRRAHVHHY